MASSALVSSEELCAVPWLVRRLTVTTGTAAAALAHGGPASVPDMVLTALTSANPTASEISVTATSTTTVTVDGEADSKTGYVYCIWFDAAAGGIS